MSTFNAFLVLSFLIFFHELGHFLAARFFGVHVEVFSIGFGKKIFSKVVGKTEYCFSLIPLGGYVQMKGQDDADPTKISSDPDSYNTKAPWKRIVILFAGPFANFLLAFLLFLVVGSMGVTKFAPIIGQIDQSLPAYEAGLQENDRIVMINEKLIETWDEVSTSIEQSVGTLVLKIEREGRVNTVSIIPKMSEAKTIFGETYSKRMLGIRPSGKTIEIVYGADKLFGFAMDQTMRASKLTLTSLQKLIEGVVPAKELGGIISIMKVTSEASDAGILALLTLTALISVNLGVFNLLPIPALDGGHIMFNTYEMITKRAPSERILLRMTTVGWVLLLSLMAFSIFNDIMRLTYGN